MHRKHINTVYFDKVERIQMKDGKRQDKDGKPE